MSERRELFVSHYEYAEMLEHLALCRFTPQGIDSSEFIAWAARRFDLKPFTEYRVVIDPAIGRAASQEGK